MNILVAVDDSEYSEEAVRQVNALSFPEGSKLRILHVLATSMLPVPAHSPPVALSMGPGSPYWPPEMLELMREIRQHASVLVDRLAKSLGRTGLEIDTNIREGDARSEIIEEAKAWPADLIVVGSHGYSGIRRWLLGNVAQSVVSHAPCSVMVARLQPRAAT